MGWRGEILQSNPDGNLGEEESGEDTGDDVDTVVVQHHLPSDRNDALAGNLHYPPSLDVLTGELQTGAEDTVNQGAQEPTETSDQDDQQLVRSDIEVLRGGRHHDSDIIRHADDEATDEAGDEPNKSYSSVSSL